MPPGLPTASRRARRGSGGLQAPDLGLGARSRKRQTPVCRRPDAERPRRPSSGRCLVRTELACGPRRRPRRAREPEGRSRRRGPVQRLVPRSQRDQGHARRAGARVRQLLSSGGWVAAIAFATTFYEALLRGERFIDAVAVARGKAFEFDGNTWAAYQCYGDPDWRLAGRGDWSTKTRKAAPDEFDHIAS